MLTTIRQPTKILKALKGDEKMRYYYAKDDYYGGETDRGFVNTKFFRRFHSKRERDDWVCGSNRLSREVCTRKDVIKYHGSRDFHEEPKWIFEEV